MSRARGGFIGATLQSIKSQRQPQPLRVNSEQYDEAKVHKAVRLLTKKMRAAAADRDALAAMHWTYVVETTLEEMEREAKEQHRLTELRIALLQVQPACKTLLADVRQMVMETNGDKALVMLKYAVAWRRVFGPQSINRLQAILDLAAMGGVLRSHRERQGAETVYVATSHSLEAFDWNKRRSALEPSQRYIGSGFSVGAAPAEKDVELVGSPVAAASQPPVPAIPRAPSIPRSPVAPPTPPAPPPAVPDIPAAPGAFDVEPRGRRIVLPPSVPAIAQPTGPPPAPSTPDVQLSGATQPPADVPPPSASASHNHHPHISTPHPFALDPPSRLAAITHPGIQVPPTASRPLLRRMEARSDGLTEGSTARPWVPRAESAELVFPSDMPSIKDQVEKAMKQARSGMNQFAPPRSPHPPTPPPRATAPAAGEIAPRHHRGASSSRNDGVPPRFPYARPPHRGPHRGV